RNPAFFVRAAPGRIPRVGRGAVPHCPPGGRDRCPASAAGSRKRAGMETQLMRNVVLALAALAVGPAAASAQNAAWADKIFKGTPSHAFGSVPRGAQLHHRFPIPNIYAVPLQITNARSTCGCLTATPSKTSLSPQEVAYLD